MLKESSLQKTFEIWCRTFGPPAINRPCGTCCQRRNHNTAPVRPSEEILCLHTSKDLTKYFIAQRDILKPPDVCSILERLWEKIQDENEEDRGKLFSAKKQLFNDPDFMAIMKDVLFRLDRYKAKDLPRLIAVLNSMRWNDRQLFKIVEPAVIREMPSMSGMGLSQVATSFTGVGCGSQLLFNQLVQCCFQTADQFTAAEVAMLAAAFSKAPHQPKQFLLGFAPLVSRHLSAFSDSQLQDIVQAYSLWPSKVSQDFIEEILHLVEERVQSEMMCLPTLVLFLRFFVLWKSRGKAARDRIYRTGAIGEIEEGSKPSWTFAMSRVFLLSTERLRLCCSSLTVEQASDVMWAYCKLQPHGTVPKGLFELLYNHILQNFSKLPMPRLVQCLLNTARGLSGHFRFWDESVSVHPRRNCHRFAFRDRRLLQQAESQVVKEVAEMESRHLTAVVQAYTLSHVASPESVSVFLRASFDKSRELAPEELSALLVSYATLRVGSSFAGHVQIDILDRLAQFSAVHFSEILWAFCALRHRDAHFFATLLRLLTPGGVRTARGAVLLCPALLEIRTYFPSLDPEGLERYTSYVREPFCRSQMHSAAPEVARESLARSLSKAGMKKVEQLVDIDGYVVDVLVPSDGNELDKPVAVQYHSAPRTLHMATGEPLGQTMMKQPLGEGFLRHHTLGPSCPNLESFVTSSFYIATSK